MHDTPVRQTVKMWEADLGEPGRRLTLDELGALEAMHACGMLDAIRELLHGTTLYLASLEGRLDRIEQYLSRVDPGRYPTGPDPFRHRAELPASQNEQRVAARENGGAAG